MLPKYDRGFFLLLLPFASIVFVVFIALTYVVLSVSYPSISKFGTKLFTENVWRPSEAGEEFVRYGLLAPLYGTLVTSFIAATIALPLSISTVYLVEELARSKLREVLSTTIDLMAGLPTVLYGLWGVEVMIPFIRDSLMTPLHSYLPWIPLFSCEPLSGASFLSAGILLAIMIIPFMHSLVQDAYRSIPRTYREAALSLGANRYEYFRIMLSMIKPAVIASLLLGLGRASSETVAVALVVGNSFNLSPCLFSPGYTIPSLIANQFSESNFYPYMQSALYAGGLVLLLLGVASSITGLIMMRKVREMDGGHQGG
ncbi:MAG: phosphate ABC transporter permease subunit PstC [Candidatus Korarchaeum sp.]